MVRSVFKVMVWIEACERKYGGDWGIRGFLDSYECASGQRVKQGTEIIAGIAPSFARVGIRGIYLRLLSADNLPCVGAEISWCLLLR